MSDKTVQPAFLPNSDSTISGTHTPRKLLSRGTGIKAVSQRFGHADVKVTVMVYSHVLAADDRAIAEGLDRLYG